MFTMNFKLCSGAGCVSALRGSKTLPSLEPQGTCYCIFQLHLLKVLTSLLCLLSSDCPQTGIVVTLVFSVTATGILSDLWSREWKTLLLSLQVGRHTHALIAVENNMTNSVL